MKSLRKLKLSELEISKALLSTISTHNEELYKFVSIENYLFMRTDQSRRYEALDHWLDRYLINYPLNQYSVPMLGFVYGGIETPDVWKSSMSGLDGVKANVIKT